MDWLARGAPNKQPLSYFPKVVNFYEDDKIFDLLDKYGPLGVTIYDCILTIVYSNGYYADLSKDKLSRMVIRKIGNKWIKSQKVVVQVIDYCADLGLIRKDLMLQDIITSEGIQKRYHKIAVKLMKRQLYSREYWLLDENGEPLLSSPKCPFNSEENGINSEENQYPSEEMQGKEKEIKRNKTEYKDTSFSPEERLEQAFRRFKECRRKMGKPVTDEAADLLERELERISGSLEERIRILDQSTMNSWTGIYPLKKEGNKQKCGGGKAKKNSFHNFEQRDTDYDAMMAAELREKLKRQEGGAET